MVGQRVGYIRVSSIDQNVERQLDGIALDRTFTDKASGKDVHRPQLEAMVGLVRDGDAMVVHSTDCLARNLDDLCGITCAPERRALVPAMTLQAHHTPPRGRPYGSRQRESMRAGYCKSPGHGRAGGTRSGELPCGAQTVCRWWLPSTDVAINRCAGPPSAPRPNGRGALPGTRFPLCNSPGLGLVSRCARR